MGGKENIEIIESEIITNGDDNVVPVASEEFVFTPHISMLTERAARLFERWLFGSFRGSSRDGQDDSGVSSCSQS